MFYSSHEQQIKGLHYTISIPLMKQIFLSRVTFHLSYLLYIWSSFFDPYTYSTNISPNHFSSGCHGALNQKSHLCAILWFFDDIPFEESEVEPGGCLYKPD